MLLLISNILSSCCSFLLLCSLVVWGTGIIGTAHAHGPVTRVPELFTASARMFLADASNGDVITVDLPASKVVARVSTPPFIMILGLTQDKRHLFAMRGRDSDRDYVTIINTGYDPTSNELRYPHVTRSMVGHSPGGAKLGHMTVIDGMTCMVNEGDAEMIVFEGDLDGGTLEALPVRSYFLANPDHYHYAQALDRLYVGHLRGGFIQVIDIASGNETDRIGDCPIVHGIIKDDETGRLFYGCSNYTLVIGTQGGEISQEVARITYPEAQRAAAFLRGSDGVFWDVGVCSYKSSIQFTFCMQGDVQCCTSDNSCSCAMDKLGQVSLCLSESLILFDQKILCGFCNAVWFKTTVRVLYSIVCLLIGRVGPMVKSSGRQIVLPREPSLEVEKVIDHKSI